MENGAHGDQPRGGLKKKKKKKKKSSEDYQHGADAFHGVDGELRVEERRVNWEILEAWRDAAEECGIPKIKEFNRGITTVMLTFR
ncbi:MAG: hypothetical protein CM1200mP22_33090 [Dehalococcoidia bacterium]|nr:MAG: hypothetical protein CM1200mP22_33090 [Dehalococcoidia bacterium]